MLLNLLPPGWPAIENDGGSDPNAGRNDAATLDATAFSEEGARALVDLRSELGIDFTERARQAILNDLHGTNDGDTFPSSWQRDDLLDGVEVSPSSCRKPRQPNRFGYKFHDVRTACWYIKFLREDVQAVTYIQSQDRHSTFRTHFGVPLHKVDELVDLFLEKGWIRTAKHCPDWATLKIKAQLLILGALNILRMGAPFNALETYNHVCTSDNRKFYYKFINELFEVREQFIHLPKNEDDLRVITDRYAKYDLPGCCGSIDVVHVKWGNCPAGDVNRAKGKESYPTIAFEVITDNERRVIGISTAQFGTRNDKHIVKLDYNVAKIRDGWYRRVRWHFYDGDGELCSDTGVYLICDNGYLQWPMLICPYKHPLPGTEQCYFSGNVESVRKDVECVFGILKKRWRILDNGIRFRKLRDTEKTFVACCILHNMMLSEMEPREQNEPRVIRSSVPVPDDIWLEGPTPARLLQGGAGRALATRWGIRRRAMSTHHKWVQSSSKRRRIF
ncbi:hypothetical protein ACHAWF_007427 [Thalassiosira exigua]